jgi:hypothetical protein
MKVEEMIFPEIANNQYYMEAITHGIFNRNLI